jgi:RNA polymerase sigma factor (sigma-70 family)
MNGAPHKEIPAPEGDGFDALLREWTPRLLAQLVRRFGDFALAEDAAQEAIIAAASQWPLEGRPDHPEAWLTRVATRRMIDHIRSDIARRRRETETVQDEAIAHKTSDREPGSQHDDTLDLLIMCCHPVLTPPSAMALTLRALCGLTTAEIAKAFFVPESTMAQRISRAKQTIKSQGAVFETPSPVTRAERMNTVLHVLYLMFNEGYVATGGHQAQRPDLTNEAIRLMREVRAHAPENTEAAGLLALMLLTDARRPARVDASGALVPLQVQDRLIWDQALIKEGVRLISDTLPKGRVGPYQIMAAIAAVHDEARRAEDTDWAQIIALYEVLKQMTDNPMVVLNQAVAVAMVSGPRAGLSLLEPLADDPRLTQQHRLDAVRAHLFEQVGDGHSAIEHYRRAAKRTGSIPERDFLLKSAARLARQNQ